MDKSFVTLRKLEHVTFLFERSKFWTLIAEAVSSVRLRDKKTFLLKTNERRRNG